MKANEKRSITLIIIILGVAAMCVLSIFSGKTVTESNDYSEIVLSYPNLKMFLESETIIMGTTIRLEPMLFSNFEDSIFNTDVSFDIPSIMFVMILISTIMIVRLIIINDIEKNILFMGRRYNLLSSLGGSIVVFGTVFIYSLISILNKTHTVDNGSSSYVEEYKFNEVFELGYGAYSVLILIGVGLFLMVSRDRLKD